MVNVMVELLLQDARDDVGGAQDTGMLGILVRTGKNKFLSICGQTSSFIQAKNLKYTQPIICQHQSPAPRNQSSSLTDWLTVELGCQSLIATWVTSTYDGMFLRVSLASEYLRYINPHTVGLSWLSR